MLKSVDARIKALILLSVLICGAFFSVASFFAYDLSRKAIIQKGVDDAFAGVNQNIQFFDHMMLSREIEWDKIFRDNLPQLADEIIGTYGDPFVVPPEEMRNIAERFGFSSLYIVDEDLMVQATSYAPELGLDLKKFSPEYTAYLRDIQADSSVHVDRVSTSTVTGKLKKYGYFSPPGSDVIFNTDINVMDALRSSDQYKLKDFLFHDFARNIMEENYLVSSFDLFIVTETDRWSMLTEGRTLDDAIARTLYGPADMVDDWEGSRTIYREVEMPFHKNPGVIFVAKVTFDDAILSPQAARDIILALSVGLVVGIAVAFWLSHRTLGRVISARAQGISNTLSLLKSDGGARVHISGNDELSTAASALNDLADTLEARERALRETNRSLEKKVTERTADLERARIIADDSNKAKSDFLMSMSHELRTPLNAIIGYANMISQPKLHGLSDDKTREAAQTIETAGMHLLTLVNTVLDLSKIEAGEYALDIEENDIAELTNDVTDMLRPMIVERGLVVAQHTDLPASKVSFDSIALKRVLVNVLSNAIKFSPHGGVISITLSSDDGLLSIAIEDQGDGMNQMEIDRALEMFGQVTTDPMLAKQGTGLGLPLSKMLINLHGGDLRIESAPGNGTRVIVSIPLRIAKESSVVA